MNWIDAAVLAFLAFSAWNGWRRGLIGELTGFLALVAAGIAGVTYAGEFDGAARATLHLGPGSAHVAGLLAFASIAYLIVWSGGFLADRVAKLPVLNVINGALGGVLAVLKTLLILVVLDYVATLAPLSEDLQRDVAASTAGRTFAGIDATIDGDLGSHLPGYLQPLWTAATHHRADRADAPAPEPTDAAP